MRKETQICLDGFEPVKRSLGRNEFTPYGGGEIRPNIQGKSGTDWEKKSYLEKLFPLEEYDKIIVLFSGGKDSLACVLDLLDRGVPKEKIELWHHDIDGGHPTRQMDWPVTQAYVHAVAKYLGITLRVSWRVNGFWGEVYRVGASWPIRYVDPKTGELLECRQSEKQIRSQELREKVLSELETEELEHMGCRMKFPAKSGNLAVRWCSSILKITVADTVIRNMDELHGIGRRMKFPAKSGCHQGRWCSGNLKAQVESKLYTDIEELSHDVKILVVSGERRQESTGRSKYNEMEIHRTNATAKAHRLVHQWRSVIDWTERDIWAEIEKWHIAPHPCYAAGWGRCSCMMCIFGLPKHWAGIRELFPDRVAEVEEDERILKFTVDNKKSLNDYIGTAESCVCHRNEVALHQLTVGEFSEDDVYCEKLETPAGAYQGAEGGPC